MGHGARGVGIPTPCPMPHAPFRYTERSPGPDTGRLVLSYWSFQADAASAPDEPYTVFPDGCASIAYVRPPGGPRLLVLVGPRVAPLHPGVYPGLRIVGFRLWPDTISCVLGIPAPSIRDYFGPLPSSIAAKFEGLAAALPETDDTDALFPALEAWTARLIPDAPSPDPRIRCAVRDIVARRGEGSMEIVAKSAALSLRQLQRLFPLTTGLTLREYARVRRLREALALRLTTPSPSWSAIAAETGFVDHAHLAREFGALTGMSPRVVVEHMEAIAHQQVRP